MNARSKESESPLMDVEAVAERLGVTVRHVRRLVSERRIPYLKWGHFVRFNPAEIAAWMDAARRPLLPHLTALDAMRRPPGSCSRTRRGTRSPVELQHRSLDAGEARGRARRAPVPRPPPHRRGLAIAQGAHPKAIQARLGHSSVQVTLDQYGTKSGLLTVTRGHWRTVEKAPLT